MARDRKSKHARARVRTTERFVLAGAAAALAGQARAHAQEVAEERSQSFQAVQGAVKEDVPGGPLLVAAYGAVWVVLLLYVVRLVRQQKRAEVNLARLEQVLANTERPK